MAAPKKPNPGPAAKKRREQGDATAARRLRAAGWTVTPPEPRAGRALSPLHRGVGVTTPPEPPPADKSFDRAHDASAVVRRAREIRESLDDPDDDRARMAVTLGMIEGTVDAVIGGSLTAAQGIERIRDLFAALAMLRKSQP